MKVNVKVVAQVFENKSFVDGGEPRWAPKGGRTFNMPVEADDVMFVGGEELKQAIQFVLDSTCTNLYKFELVEYDIEFQPAIDIPEGKLGGTLKALA